MNGDAREWTSVAQGWRAAQPQRLWRAHADAITVSLCERWWPSSPVRTVLKTDLFDEAFGDGLRAFLRQRAQTAIGIDLAHDVARWARQELGSRGALEGPGLPSSSLMAATADARRLPFASGAFDAVISNSTLDHFRAAEDIRVALREVHRVLAPGGVLVLTLDNRSNPLVALRNRLPFGVVHRLGLVPYFVGATLTPRETERLLTGLGFAIDEMALVLHCPRVLGVAAAAVCDRLGRGARQVFLRGAAAWEALGRWPTRTRTGYFIAVRARRTA
jgi:SAM-dependent methyltransferase